MIFLMFPILLPAITLRTWLRVWASGQAVYSRLAKSDYPARDDRIPRSAGINSMQRPGATVQVSASLSYLIAYMHDSKLIYGLS